MFADVFGLTLFAKKWKLLNVNDFLQVYAEALCVEPLLAFVTGNHVAGFGLAADTVKLVIKLRRSLKLKQVRRLRFCVC